MRHLQLILLVLGAIALPPGAFASHDDLLRDEWPTVAADAARTGSRGHTPGPGTGEIVWRYQTGELDVIGTPAVAFGKVFLGADDKNLYALDAKTGSLVWRHETGAEVRGSPVVANGTVFVASEDGHLYAIDAEDGSLRWRVWIERYLDSTPTFADGTLYLGTKEGPFMALNATDGTTRWTFDVEEDFLGRASTSASPLVLGDGVYFGSYNTRVYSLDRATGAKRWDVVLVGDGRDPIATDGEAIFVTGAPGMIHALDPAKGATLWTKEIPVSAGSPSVRNGTIFLTHSEGAIAVNATTGEEVWSQPNAPRGSSTIAATDTTLYMRASGGSPLIAIDIATGEIVWERVIAAYIRSSPVVADGILYVGSSQYRVFALDAGSGSAPIPSASAPSGISPSIGTSTSSQAPTPSLGFVLLAGAVALATLFVKRSRSG